MVLLNNHDPSYDHVRKGIFMDGSHFSRVIRKSSMLQTAHACLIASALPMSVDTLLDYPLKLNGITMWNERLCFLLSLLIPSIGFLLFHESPYMPGIYLIQQLSQELTLFSLAVRAVLPNLLKKSKLVLPGLVFASLFTFSLRCILEAFEAFLNFNEGHSLAVRPSLMMFYLSWLLGVSSLLYWMHLTSKSKGQFSFCSLSHEEYQELIYATTLALAALSALLLNIFFHATTWPNASERLLVSYVFIQLGTSVLLTVLPGRVLRMNAIISLEMLSLKQIFIRYVSHEIRSPLNVVHSGLDLLKDEILRLECEVNKAVLDLVEDIIEASGIANCILDDLLNYENIDAGSFKLEMKWKPLTRYFGQKLKWVELLAEKRHVVYELIDETGSTTASDLHNSPVESNHSSGCPSIPFLGTTVDESNAAIGISPFLNSYLHIDAIKIDQVVRNLVSNALKFTPAKGTVTVKMSCRPRNASDEETDNIVGWFRFEVTDSGVGLSAEQQKAVFEEFTHFKQNKLHGGGGRGLGLWISRRIVDMHRGVLSVNSEGVGHGSTFYFELPLFSESAATAINFSESIQETTNKDMKITTPSKLLFSSVRSFGQLFMTDFTNDRNDALVYPETDLLPSEMASTRPKRDYDCDDSGDSVDNRFKSPENALIHFLIVDDSSLNRKIVRRILESDAQFADSYIEEADDGVTAIHAVKELAKRGHEFDFILMDFVMLSMHGPEAAKYLRTNLKFGGYIVGITGNALPHDIANFLRNGADEVLIKPINKIGLKTLLIQMLENPKNE
mmetsp:Transcript_30754/g.42079  ORF Transcript_30754/g.42079 Transcript_30754/m.42079 type:complete len:787 (-) Transcript_30754:184-2544(-)